MGSRLMGEKKQIYNKFLILWQGVDELFKEAIGLDILEIDPNTVPEEIKDIYQRSLKLYHSIDGFITEMARTPAFIPPQEEVELSARRIIKLLIKKSG